MARTSSPLPLQQARDAATVSRLAASLESDEAVREIASEPPGTSFQDWVESKQLQNELEQRLDFFRDAAPGDQRFLAQYTLLLNFNSGDSAHEYARLERMKSHFRKNAERLAPAFCSTFSHSPEEPQHQSLRTAMIHEFGVATLHALEPSQEGGIRASPLNKLVTACPNLALTPNEIQISNAYLHQRSNQVSPEARDTWNEMAKRQSAETLELH